jgi:hypothetical protein
MIKETRPCLSYRDFSPVVEGEVLCMPLVDPAGD